MPEPKDRDDKEEELMLLLLILFSSRPYPWWYVNQTSKPWFVEQLKRSPISDRFRKVARDSYGTFASTYGMPADRILMESIAIDLQERKVDELATRLEKKTRKWREKETDRAKDSGSVKTSTGTIDDPDWEYDELYPESDAEREAVTTFTDLWSKTEFRARDRYEDYYGMRLIAYWMTEPGACPICEPLHGYPEEVWGLKFPTGPPAHPNCRCHLEFLEEF